VDANAAPVRAMNCRLEIAMGLIVCMFTPQLKLNQRFQTTKKFKSDNFGDDNAKGSCGRGGLAAFCRR
jgi:hypothetical protein